MSFLFRLFQNVGGPSAGPTTINKIGFDLYKPAVTPF